MAEKLAVMLSVPWQGRRIIGGIGSAPVVPPLHGPNVQGAAKAEIMFGANVWTGLLLLSGIAWSNWRHALLTLMGTLVGTALALHHNDPQQTIMIGILGTTRRWRRGAFICGARPCCCRYSGPWCRFR